MLTVATESCQFPTINSGARGNIDEIVSTQTVDDGQFHKLQQREAEKKQRVGWATVAGQWLGCPSFTPTVPKLSVGQGGCCSILR